MKNRISYVYGIIVSIIWGASFIATKIIVMQIPPAMAGFFRFFIAYITLLIIGKFMRLNDSIDKKSKLWVILMGFSGVTLYFLFENFGLQFTSPSNASLIVSSVPIFTIIFNYIFLKIHYRKITIIGIILGFIGIYILIFGFSFDFNINAKGDLIMFLSVFSWIAYTFFAKRVNKKHSIIVITRELSYYGMIFFIPFVIYEKYKFSFCLLSFNIELIIAFLYLGIICSALGYVLWNKALQNENSHLVNSFIYLIPLFSIITEMLYMKTSLTLNILISSLFIIAGLFIAHFFK